MQAPLFRRYGIDEATFWAETNALMEHYRKRGYQLSGEISYLNHLLTYVLAGKFGRLNNRTLRECGADIAFYPGLPAFFDLAKTFVAEKGIPKARDQAGALHREHRPRRDGPRQRYRPVRGRHLGLRVHRKSHCSPASSGRRR
jgi:hypothetical protein